MVIVNYRTSELTLAAVTSVLTEPEVREVIVVDNASADGSVEFLRDALQDQRVRVIEAGRNGGFGSGVNFGVAACRSPLLLILNSDAILLPGSLGLLAAVILADEAAGVVAPAVFRADGRSPEPGTFGRLPTRLEIARLGGRWEAKGGCGASLDDQRPEWVSGVAMCIRTADFRAIGGFDEDFEMYFEDIDLCRRIHAQGKTVRRHTAAGVVHLGGESWRSRRDQKRRFHTSKVIYAEKVGASRLELRWIRLLGGLRTALLPSDP